MGPPQIKNVHFVIFFLLVIFWVFADIILSQKLQKVDHNYSSILGLDGSSPISKYAYFTISGQNMSKNAPFKFVKNYGSKTTLYILTTGKCCVNIVDIHRKYIAQTKS